MGTIRNIMKIFATFLALGAASPLFEAVDTPIAALTGDQETGLARHNHYRQLHKNTPNQSSDSVLCNDAAVYAQKLAEKGKLEHDSDELNEKKQGENLYMARSSRPITSPGYDRAVDKWYAEIDDYDWNNPDFSSKTGHFTQVVWKDSINMCMAHAYSEDQKEVYIVARYKPRGNYKGQFGTQVQPLK